ncbi:lipoxygenase [Gymnopilus junonius]|uniref:Manganese lipoxygenase n=1 Tax=Gymnopilus junonius TaxID=109634 RepID=A0A9P5N7W0_GYMJU|nr:lipoxygenase [Gymnopilus junonius]
MVKEADKALRRELEEERTNLQEKLTHWENERSALKRGLDNAKKSREQLETEAAKAKETRAKSRQELENNWSTKLDAQEKARSTVVQSLQNQLEKRIVAQQEGERQGREISPPSYEEVYSGIGRPRSATYQFVQSGIYPPYLKSIPREYQTTDIFDFATFVETGSMVFLQPNLLPNKRKKAPDALTTRSMQDLVDHNLQLHLEARDGRSSNMYTRRNIGLRDDWYTDAVFGQQQFTGTNPTTITLASTSWIEEFKAASCTQRLIRVEKLLTDDPNSLYVQDYSDYRPTMGIASAADFSLDGRYGCSSVVLFRLEPEGKLHPLAITIDYKGSMESSVTIFNRRHTSSIPGDEAADWPWRYAKMCTQVSDWFRHEVTVHLTYTHLIEEVLIVAAHRTFDPSHIVLKLLKPHWTTTLSLNKAARDTLVPKIIIPLTGFTASQTYVFIKSQFSSFDWTGSYVPNDLPRRGFPIEDLDKFKFHNYGYARNIYRIWQILRKFVSSVLTQVYVGGDAQVAGDSSVAAFCREARSNSGGQLFNFPDIKTLDELIDFITMGIHIASPQHTAVNYLQQYYQTFVPNKPSALFQPLPRSLEELQTYTEKDILSALPIHRPREWLVMAQVPYLLSFEVAEENTIMHYAKAAPNQLSTPGPIRDAAKVLEDDLEDFVYTVSAHSMELDDQQTPYLVLDPVRTAISILI